MTDYGTLTDRELAIAGGSSDQRAVAALYDRYFSDVYDFAARTLRNIEPAADIVQSTFAEALRDLRRGTVPENVKSWLYAIALRNATARSTQSSPQGQPPPQYQTSAPSFTAIDAAPPSDLEAVRNDSELKDVVWRSATDLSPREYALLDLSVRRGMTANELAGVIAVSDDTANTTRSSVGDSFEQAVTASLLVQRGRDDCPELAGLLARSNAPETSPQVRQAVLAHLQSCQRCQATTSAYPGPLSVFAALTNVPAAAGLKEVIWGNVLAATTAVGATPAAEAPARRRRWPWIIALLLLLAVLAAVAAPLLLSGGEDAVGDPDDVRSTSHEVGEESTDNVVRMVWSRQDGVMAYSVSWSTVEFELPDEVGDLSGDATDAESPELEPGDWYFHLRTQRDDGTWTTTVHVGPFEIIEGEPSPTEEPPEPTRTPSPAPTPTEEPPTPQPTSPPTPVPATSTPVPTQTP
jgi:RNA polymerase sigma factor (sigma-70 family)